MANNKVQLSDGTVLLDLTGDTVTPQTLLSGVTAHDAAGNPIVGTSDGSNLTVAFTAATTRANVATGEKLSVLFGKIAKWFSDLGNLAFKSTVAKSDLASDVQTSLDKADSALQSAPVKSVNGATGEVKGTFYVTVTQRDDNSVIADKTGAEVYAAYAAGYAVYAVVKFTWDTFPYMLPLVVALNSSGTVMLGFAALGSISPTDPLGIMTVSCYKNSWSAWSATVARSGDIPEELKNPYSLNIKIGDTTTSYDGSAAKTVEIPEGVPSVTAADNGKFLRVVNGVWAAVEIANANGGSF